MIKINLLLARKEKKKAALGKEFIVLIVSVVLLLGALVFTQWELNKKSAAIVVQDQVALAEQSTRQKIFE